MSRPRTPTRTARPTSPAKKKSGKPGPKRQKRIAARAAAPRPEKSDEQKAQQAASRVLSGKAARHLRALGHHLDAVVQIGKDGVTDGVVEATRTALLAHELVKVRIGQDAPVERKAAGEELAERAGAALAQILGRTLLLYKRHPHKPRIVLPR